MDAHDIQNQPLKNVSLIALSLSPTTESRKDARNKHYGAASPRDDVQPHGLLSSLLPKLPTGIASILPSANTVTVYARTSPGENSVADALAKGPRSSSRNQPLCVTMLITSSSTVLNNCAIPAARFRSEVLSSMLSWCEVGLFMISHNVGRPLLSVQLVGVIWLRGVLHTVEISDISEMLVDRGPLLPERAAMKSKPIRSKCARSRWVTASHGSPVTRSRKMSLTCTFGCSGKAMAAVCNVRKSGDTNTTVGSGPPHCLNSS
mmetsp:Transcript_90997/g.262336  ORF Transcript_90997/g.262336 Transcript_90997/m.262336 type:complete len:262 (-) Transcript_90997:421-1206(-)